MHCTAGGLPSASAAQVATAPARRLRREPTREPPEPPPPAIEAAAPEPEDDSAAAPRKRGLRAGIAARAVRRLRGNAEPEAPDGFEWGGTF